MGQSQFSSVRVRLCEIANIDMDMDGLLLIPYIILNVGYGHGQNKVNTRGLNFDTVCPGVRQKVRDDKTDRP